MTVLVPLLVAIVGALVYGLTAGKGQELGRLAFAIGLFWFVYSLAGSAIHIG